MFQVIFTASQHQTTTSTNPRVMWEFLKNLEYADPVSNDNDTSFVLTFSEDEKRLIEKFITNYDLGRSTTLSLDTQKCLALEPEKTRLFEVVNDISFCVPSSWTENKDDTLRKERASLNSAYFAGRLGHDMEIKHPKKRNFWHWLKNIAR